MKTLYLSIIAILPIIVLANSHLAHAEMSKSLVTINGTQYEIVINTINSAVNTVSPNLYSYIRNSLDMNITSDKTYNGSITLTLTKDAVANIFCIQKSYVDNFLKNDQLLFVDVDNNNTSLNITPIDDNVSLTFGIQAGSKNATIVNQFVGMPLSPLVDFKGVPIAGIYRPGQQVNFSGTLVDDCSRFLGNGTIQFTSRDLNITKQVTSDKNGKFTINFTIPENIESGRYKATIDGTKGNTIGFEVLDFIVEKKGESNIPFLVSSDLGSFEIPYHFDHGEIIDVSNIFVGNYIDVTYYATQNGTMEILFPKTLMAFVSGNVNNTTVRSGSLTLVRFQERNDSENHRIFDIPVFKGKNSMNISLPKEGDDAVYNNSGLLALGVGDRNYPVSFNITGGIIQNFYSDPFYKKITVETIGVKGGGHLHLELPRYILDAVQDGKDSRFLVTNSIIIDGIPGKSKILNYTESLTSEETRTLEINFPQDRSFIQITGTQIIPEFPFVLPILLISIASLVVFTRLRK